MSEVFTERKGVLLDVAHRLTTITDFENFCTELDTLSRNVSSKKEALYAIDAAFASFHNVAIIETVYRAYCYFDAWNVWISPDGRNKCETEFKQYIILRQAYEITQKGSADANINLDV